MNMRRILLAVWSGMVLANSVAPAATVFETTSPYHHIRVVDEGDLRTLCFDDATETRMSLRDPSRGHFEYTEYFHMPWLWNMQITNVLMIGLGGGSAQRAFERYYPGVRIETAEIDPMVVKVAKDYFMLRESDRQKVQVGDGRMHLRRSTVRHDLVILDAYLGGRYGSSIPQHLATKEFFELVRSHLTTNGVVAYNVIGTVNDWHAGIVGAIYRTLKEVFPQVYLFPARGCQNVVLVATMSGQAVDLNWLRQRAALFSQVRRFSMPGLRGRVEAFRGQAPASVASSPILTDDYAPVEGLAAGAAF
jgi:spermidine synthase